MTETELTAFCRCVLPFSALPVSVLEAVLSASRQRSFAAKEYIFFEGAEGDAGYLLLSGRVAMVKSSPNGREMIVELLPAGEFFGVVALIDNRPFPLSARAQSAVEVLSIPRSAIAKVADGSPALLQGLLAVLSQRLQTSHNIARSLAHDKVEVRIAAALLALSIGQQSDIEIGRQELADLTGTTIETASRVCKLWEREKLIDLSTHGVVRVLNKSALREAADPAL